MKEERVYPFYMKGDRSMSMPAAFFSAPGRLRLPKPVCCWVFILLISGSISLPKAAILDEARQCWENEYAFLNGNVPSRIDPSNAEKEYAANVNALLLSSDRDPLDVVLRRTNTLLDALGALSGSPVLESPAARLDELEQREKDLGYQGGNADNASARKELFLKVCELRREIALCNPLLDFDEMIFSYEPNRICNVQSLNSSVGTSKHFKRSDGNADIQILSGYKKEPSVRSILPSTVPAGSFAGRRWTTGTFNGMALSYDGKSIAFAWGGLRNERSNEKEETEDNINLYRMDIDGGNFVQLTDLSGNECQPCWIPGGRIAFVAELKNSFVRCHSGRSLQEVCGTLASMNATGGDIIPLSWHETSEAYPSVDNQGMLVYIRWDYVDRGWHSAQHIWHCFPDGRDPRAYHGNYPLPYYKGQKYPDYDLFGRDEAFGWRAWSEYFPRAIPGESKKLVATAATHHEAPGGPVILVDIGTPDDGMMSQVKRVNAEAYPPVDGVSSKETHRGFYLSPWPLNNEFFIVSDPAYGPVSDSSPKSGIYLIDIYGNRILLYADPVPGDYLVPWYATPLRAVDEPPQLPPDTYQGARSGLPEHKRAVMSVINVYESDFDWPEGTKIKNLRLVQVFSKPWIGEKYSTRKFQPYIAYGGELGDFARGVLGTVPVEDDGSAYFEAPVEKEFYIQALNEKGMAVQSMRSGTYVHPGEHLSCLGCHEDKWNAASIPTAPTALKRPPSTITPGPEGSMPLTYGRLVRPVFLKACKPCHVKEGKGPQFGDELVHHDEKKPYSFFPPRDEKRTQGVPIGYAELEDYIFYYNDCCHQDQGQGTRSEANALGAQASKLLKHLDTSHYNVQLTDDEYNRVITWLDNQAPLLGSYSLDEADIRKQYNGELVLPEFEFDAANPTGIEKNADPVTIDPRHPLVSNNTGNRLSIYLTPSTIRVGTDGASLTKVEIISVSGARIVSRTIHTSQRSLRLPRKSLASGLYFIKANLADGVVVSNTVAIIR